MAHYAPNMKYIARYRCLLCNRVLELNLGLLIAEDKEEALRYLKSDECLQMVNDIKVHACVDGQLGLAQFVGFGKRSASEHDFDKLL